MKQMFNRQRIYIIPVIIMMFLCTLIPVFADTGPKPSLTIQCEGFPENAYVSVLSAVSDYGPNRPWNPEDRDDEYFISQGIKREVYEAFNAEAKRLCDAGTPYYFWGVVTKCSDEYLFGYWPPEEFRIMIYLEDTDTVLLSEETYTRKAFRTTYRCTYSGNDLIIKDVSSAFPSLSGAIARILLTIVIEYLVSLMFMKHTDRSRLVLILANIATQLFLNFILAIATVRFGTSHPVYLIALLIAEGIIILAEWLIYRKWIPHDQLNKPFIYSAAANVSSYLLGLLIIRAIPIFPM